MFSVIPFITLDIYKGKSIWLKDSNQDIYLLGNNHLVKTSASVRAGAKFPFTNERRILLLDGFIFRIKIINDIIDLTPNGQRKLDLKHRKDVIYNYFLRAFEELDEYISCRPNNGLLLGDLDKGLWVVYCCFCVVYKIGNDYLFTESDDFSDDEYRATIITYSYI